MELHEHPLRLLARAFDVVYAAARVLVLECVLGQISRVYPGVAAPPRLTAILAQPHARRRDGNGQPVRVSRPGADRVQAQTTAARLPVRAGGLLPQSRVDLPARSAVVALEQDSGVPARVHAPLGLTGGDHPDPLERLIATFRQRDSIGLLPFRVRIAVGEEDLGPVERGSHGREQPPAPGIAGREVHGLPRERARRDLKAGARLAVEQKQALFRSHH